MRRQLSVIACVGLLIAWACGTAPAPTPRYTVEATVLAVSGKPITACYAIELSLPPAGCGGVEVKNIDLASIAGSTVFANGTVQTPILRLVGAWDGHALTLTELPQVTPDTGTVPRPIDQLPPPGSGAQATGDLPQQIAHDTPLLTRQGIQVLSVGTGADGVELLLAVADPASVRTLYDRYGQVHISGWLQPA
jgi:hypothetical protein